MNHYSEIENNSTRDRRIQLIAAFLMALAWWMGAESARAQTLLSVPFTSQAPFGNWAQPWQDFCEEASTVMAAHFIWKLPLTPAIANAQMQIIKQYEELMFDRHIDTSAAETAQVLTDLYGFRGISLKTVTSARDLKTELAAGNALIVPVAGRMLINPYFVPPGPYYHMMVVTGFDDTAGTFLVNDPGTRRGKNFSYSQSSFFAAIHDWNNGNVLEGAKHIIIVRPAGR